MEPTTGSLPTPLPTPLPSAASSAEGVAADPPRYQTPAPSIWRRIGKPAPLLVAGIALGGCVTAGLIDPERNTVFPPCPFRMITGWYCPGCGMTRALHRLVRGDVVAAAQFNLLLVVLFPIGLYALVQWLDHTYGWLGGRLKPVTMPKAVWISAIVLFAAWAVLRNTPIPYLDALARGRV